MQAEESSGGGDGMNYGAMSGGLALTQLFSSLQSGITNAMYAKFRSKYQASQLRFNAQLQGLQADEIKAAGDRIATQKNIYGRQIRGAQIANYAAQGVETGVGSASDVQTSTRNQVSLDALAIQNTAWRQAFGHRLQALNLNYAAQQTEVAGEHEFTQTLLSGGLKALGYGISAVYGFAGA